MGLFQTWVVYVLYGGAGIGSGGLGGGANATDDFVADPNIPANGVANTGGGGAGQSSSGSGSGSAGGSGIVILRYLGSQRGSGGTVTTDGSYTYHTFRTGGTFSS